MTFTNIRKVTNQQPADPKGGVAFANNQKHHSDEGWACVPGYDKILGRYLPIPAVSEYEEGLWIYTIRGRCQVIDHDWTIKGKWDDGTVVELIARGGGAGGEVQATIASDGYITMSKYQ